MKKLRVLKEILKSTNLDKILMVFCIFFFFSCLVFTYFEPGIIYYSDGLWYGLSIITSLGFGDIVATTNMGRIFTALLSMYSIAIIALMPGIIINYYQEILRIKSNESVIEFMEKLEDLPNLSKKELREIADKVKERRYQI